MKNTQALVTGVREVRGLDIAIEPEINVVPVISTSNRISVYTVAEGMDRLGWKGIGRMRNPECLRFIVMPHHEEVIPEFLNNLEKVTRQVERGTTEDEPISIGQSRTG